MSLIISTYWLTFVIGIHLLNPCKPGLAGYWLLPQCTLTCGKIQINNSNGYLSVALPEMAKIALLISNAWVLCISAFPTTFVINNVQILCTMSLRCLLTRFHSLTDVDSMLSYYKQIQILTKLGNDIGKGMVTLIFFAATVVQPFSIVNLVTTNWLEDGASFAAGFSVSILMQSILIFIGYGGCLAGIYEESKIALKSISKRILKNIKEESRCRRRIQMRMLKSCTFVKIRFGSFNYIC